MLSVKTLIHSIVALTFFIQALIPAGFMPNAHASEQGTALVICSGLDVKTIYIDDHGQEMPSHEKTDVKIPCVYAGLSSYSSPEPYQIFQDRIGYIDSGFVAVSLEFIEADKVVKPPAIGPPALL